MFQGIALLLGKKGIMLVIGIVVFLYSYSNSVKLFQFIEDQTMGTREYILEKLERLYIRKILGFDVTPENVTMGLLALSFGSAGLTMVVFVLLDLWQMGIVLSIVIGFAGWKLPKPIIDTLIEKRIKDYQNQLVDALNLLGNGLRAGLSLPQSFGMVVDELDAPVSQEFRLVLEQNKIGVPLEECMEDLVKRMPTQDNQMFVTSINILRETGGNLPEVFDTITEVVRERIRLQQKIDTFIAQGKVQAIVISAMPTVMMFFYIASNPDQMKKVFTSGLGIALILGAYVLNIVGYLVIRKVIQIKA